MFDKTQDLYVKTAVIQNGVADAHGDVLDSKEIKQIFTSYNNQDNFEVDHDGIPIQGVSLLENYISKTDETIGTTTVPSGSWNVVLKISSPEYQKGIIDGTYGGVSLSNRVKKECNCQLHGNILYKDLPSAECVIPIFISLVDAPANGVGFEIFDYDTYILKSKGSYKMSLLEELKALVKKAEETETPVIQKDASEEVDVQEESEPATEDVKPSTETEEDDTEEPEEPEANNEEDAVIKKSCNNEEEEANVEKSEISLEDLAARIEALENKLSEDDSKVEKSEDEPKPDEKEDKEEVAPVITKSAKVVITEEATTTKNNFYEMTGRDPITGKKL